MLALCTNAQDSTHTAYLKNLDDRQSYSSLSPLLSDATSPNSLQLDVDFHMNSNAVFTTFAGAFLTQNTITPAMINRVLDYTHGNIKYEDELKAGLAYKHFFKKNAIQLYASYYHRNMRNLVTSHDAFKLLFEGNAPFENQTASLSNINFEELMYNQYSVGISKSDGHFFAGINLSYLQGFNNQQLRNPNGSLYTAPYGEYLDVSYDLTFNEATPGASRFFDLNGQGVSVDLKFEYSTDKWRFGITVQDLGYISWRRHPVNYAADTSYRFNGLEISNLTNINGSGIQGINIDFVLCPYSAQRRLTMLTTPPSRVRYRRPSPTCFKLKKHDMILSMGVNTRLLTGYYAYGYVKTTYLLDHQWSTSVSAGAGGYSLFNLGWDVGKRWKNLDFLIGTNNLIGCIVPMYYPGSSFYVRIAAHF